MRKKRVGKFLGLFLSVAMLFQHTLVSQAGDGIADYLQREVYFTAADGGSLTSDYTQTDGVIMIYGVLKNENGAYTTSGSFTIDLSTETAVVTTITAAPDLSGTEVATAVADENYSFVGWYKDGTKVTSDTGTQTIYGMTYVAKFAFTLSKVLNTEDEKIPDEDGNDATVSLLDPEAEIVGGELNADGNIVVPNDENGNAPISVQVDTEDTDGDGVIDKVTVIPTYPSTVYTDSKVIDETGEEVKKVTITDADENEATLSPLDPDAEVIGGYLDEDGNIVVPNDENGNKPLSAEVIVEDTDGDGINDKVTVIPTYPLVDVEVLKENGNTIKDVTVQDIDGNDASLEPLDPDAEIIGGELDEDGNIVVPNDENGNPPVSAEIIVEDTDGDGVVDKVTIDSIYPLVDVEVIEEDGNTIENVTVQDEDGNDVSLEPLHPDAEIIGGELNADGNIVVPNDENGNAPTRVEIIAEDMDGDGVIDKVTVEAFYETTITIEYYLENLEDEEFTLDALTSVDCTIGDLFSTLSLEKEYEGFTLNAELTTADGQEVTDETTITHNMIVKLYYERNIYTVTYEGNGNDQGPTEVVEELAYKYGAELVVKSPEELGMAYTDHTFLYWEGSVLNPGDTWIVTSDKTLVAQWSADEVATATAVTTTAKAVKTGDTANNMLVYLLFGTAVTAIIAGYRRAKEREF